MNLDVGKHLSSPKSWILNLPPQFSITFKYGTLKWVTIRIFSFTVSLEDAHRHNDLSLFDKFMRTTIILGVVTIANSRVETVNEIKERVTSVLRHIPAERLILAPDCGLGYLPKDILKQKLQNLVAAANIFWKCTQTLFLGGKFVITNTKRSFKNISP